MLINGEWHLEFFEEEVISHESEVTEDESDKSDKPVTLSPETIE